MIDALLFAVRDGIRSAGFGYGVPECDITASGGVNPPGMPPPGVGNLYVSVYELTSRSGMRRNLDEYFDFGVTLTMRAIAPQGRIGDQQLASKLARVSMKGQPSFNARMEQLRAYLHMNWNIMGQFDPYYTWTLGSANYNLSQWLSGTVYGFIEPAGYAGREEPKLVGGDWFSSEPTQDVPAGLKCEMRFTNARRMQPQTAAVGPYA